MTGLDLCFDIYGENEGGLVWLFAAHTNITLRNQNRADFFSTLLVAAAKHFRTFSQFAGMRSSRVELGRRTEFHTATVRPEDILVGHLTFALKHDSIQLTFPVLAKSGIYDRVVKTVNAIFPPSGKGDVP